MPPSDPIIHPPHFPIQALASVSVAVRSADSSPHEVGGLILRSADCLTAALQESTAEAGLNEARFRVLAALSRLGGAECSQSELAALLLQSESNLSTLLERMDGDGLISRTRSRADRRRSLIRIAPAGLEALATADRARELALARLVRSFSPDELAQLAGNLRRFVQALEASLGVDVRQEHAVPRAGGTVKQDDSGGGRGQIPGQSAARLQNACAKHD